MDELEKRPIIVKLEGWSDEEAVYINQYYCDSAEIIACFIYAFLNPYILKKGD